MAKNHKMMKPDTGGDTGTEQAPAPEQAPAQAAVMTPAEFSAAHPIVETTLLELKKLVIDAGTQPRVAIDDEVVKEYGEIVKAAIKAEQPNPFDALPDEKLPQVFRDPTGRCVLADGFHRYGGHKLSHAKEMRVAIREGSERDALRYSLGTNQEHGVRRTNRDKQRAVKTALADAEWSQMNNMDIARACGVSDFLVRELRSVAKSPAVRTVTRAGKSSKMDTSAIGKGKGGGKKGKAKDAKKAGKPIENPDAQLDKDLMKIAEAVGGAEGGKIRAAVRDGALPLTHREVREWATFSPSKIKAVAPLVTGGARMKPTKAFDFIGSELAEKIVTELHNRALGGGGTYEFKDKSVTITATHTGK